jgi:hypothetical protein
MKLLAASYELRSKIDLVARSSQLEARSIYL